MKIEIGEVRSLLTSANDVYMDLTGGLQSLADSLESINTIVKSDQLSASNKRLSESLISNAKAAAELIPKVKEFLAQQITQYEVANENAKQDVDALIQAINSTFTAPKA